MCHLCPRISCSVCIVIFRLRSEGHNISKVSEADAPHMRQRSFVSAAREGGTHSQAARKLAKSALGATMSCRTTMAFFAMSRGATWAQPTQPRQTCRSKNKKRHMRHEVADAHAVHKAHAAHVEAASCRHVEAQRGMIVGALPLFSRVTQDRGSMKGRPSVVRSVRVGGR